MLCGLTKSNALLCVLAGDNKSVNSMVAEDSISCSESVPLCVSVQKITRAVEKVKVSCYACMWKTTAAVLRVSHFVCLQKIINAAVDKVSGFVCRTFKITTPLTKCYPMCV